MLAALAPLLALAAGYVESRFFLPPSLRAPFFDVVFQETPLEDTLDSAGSQLLNIRYADVPLKCVIPEGPQITYNTVLQPLKDVDVIERAREAIGELAELTVTTVDDVWGWIIDFDTSIVQCLPQREDAPLFTLVPTSFTEIIGQPGDAEGQNLRTAQPVVVNDRHMLMAAFTNGSLCDLTRKGRNTRLFFTCDPDADVPNVLQVDEPYSCTYEMLIGTDKLCAFPEFTEPQLPTNDILCGPDPEFASPSEIERFRSIVSDGVAPFDEEALKNTSSRPQAHPYGLVWNETSLNAVQQAPEMGYIDDALVYLGEESGLTESVLREIAESFIEHLESYPRKESLLLQWLYSIDDYFSTESGREKLLESNESLVDELVSLIGNDSLVNFAESKAKLIRRGFLAMLKSQQDDNLVRDDLIQFVRQSEMDLNPKQLLDDLKYTLRHAGPESIKGIVEVLYPDPKASKTDARVSSTQEKQRKELEEPTLSVLSGDELINELKKAIDNLDLKTQENEIMSAVLQYIGDISSDGELPTPTNSATNEELSDASQSSQESAQASTSTQSTHAYVRHEEL